MEKKKVLVVDDDQRFRSLLAATFGNTFSLLEADDGEEALSMVRQDRPDLVVLDMMMPKLDGYAVCSAIKRDPITRNIPVVIFSAKKEEEDKRRAMEIGASAYFVKPFSPLSFLWTVAKMLN